MSATVLLVTAMVGGLRLAFPLAQVVRVVRAAEVTLLPGAPEVVHGMLDIAGQVVPVVSARHRFALPPQAVTAAGQFVLLQGEGRMLAVVIDEALGLQECSDADLTACEGVALEGVLAEGIARLPDGLAVITDAERFLFPAESRALEAALAES